MKYLYSFMYVKDGHIKVAKGQRKNIKCRFEYEKRERGNKERYKLESLKRNISGNLEYVN